jgi:hypothetical protein
MVSRYLHSQVQQLENRLICRSAHTDLVAVVVLAPFFVLISTHSSQSLQSFLNQENEKDQNPISKSNFFIKKNHHPFENNQNPF